MNGINISTYWKELLSSDGYLHIPSDKSSFVAAIEKYKCSPVQVHESLQISKKSPSDTESVHYRWNDNCKKTLAINTCEDFA